MTTRNVLISEAETDSTIVAIATMAVKVSIIATKIATITSGTIVLATIMLATETLDLLLSVPKWCNNKNNSNSDNKVSRLKVRTWTELPAQQLPLATPARKVRDPPHRSIKPTKKPQMAGHLPTLSAPIPLKVSTHLLAERLKLVVVSEDKITSATMLSA